MDTLDQLRAFVATAQTGSFTAGARLLGLSNRLTSKYVAELERDLGVRLLQRTTRKVGLTPSGAELMARAPALLEGFDELIGAIRDDAGALSGTIRIAAPVIFGEARLVGLLNRFRRANPGLEIDLRLSDAHVDLAAEGIDLAFRAGSPRAFSLKMRKLGMIQTRLVASQSYLDAAGIPREPAELAEHECIIDTNQTLPRRWMFRKDGAEVAIAVKGGFAVNSARGAAELARAGAGIAYAPDFAVDGDIAGGHLRPLLTDYETLRIELSVVWLDGQVLPRKLRALVDFAAQEMRASGSLVQSG
ncbi:LysR family transcriptional regulator [Ponticoccus sp. SC2-23]|uniref:LysR family transcriptional regulator n=1 Tax=Alexandriicola marinus TaxID=2081710 RepID=UPI000FDCD54B|nr:LysR family transcriptional regulator [Alexandriicola marinus]MBM1221473.1 LysR family transcriptional regulator [Ponticoccus sp. SC6-9]MBM1226514.1 LysR family transcriptional regulator [Ponticoccus sp. SC6-15]MBM1230465.1 LysR family transcriptional regulator [Ponticoccus sp. SC6-38]MBM1234988.1 LysR family transcriptional regulator [Ponticoccus sp. SC6-45]MBM1239486.1 LysR family transcriptional regulator [Ponticoccus sp. SC6-49]MBM1243268.1 LysR family transcriptional regulator [Pontic